MNELSIMNAMPQPKVYNGQRVVTLRDIDEAHKRVSGTAWRNFNENRHHFEEGIDFIHVTQTQNNEIRGFEIGKRGTPLNWANFAQLASPATTAEFC